MISVGSVYFEKTRKSLRGKALLFRGGLVSDRSYGLFICWTKIPFEGKFNL